MAIADGAGFQKTLNFPSQLNGDAQSCSHSNNSEAVVEDLHSRFKLSRRQAWNKTANLNIKNSQFIHWHAAEITRLVRVAFFVLVDTDSRAMAQDDFTCVWENKGI